MEDGEGGFCARVEFVSARDCCGSYKGNIP